MTLLQVRSMFRDVTGRYDLVDSNGADIPPILNGTFFINAGCRFLDGRQDNPKSALWYKKDIAAGDHKVEFTYARSILEVWVQDGDGRALLEASDLKALRNDYPEAVANLTQGVPKYWAPAILGLAPSQSALIKNPNSGTLYTTQFTYDWEDIIFADELNQATHWGYSGVILMPPSDGVYTISVLGEFYTDFLSADGDRNYWTERRPELLVKAAAMQLEAFYRNSAGVSDWMSAMLSELNDVDNDVAAQLAVGVTRMGG